MPTNTSESNWMLTRMSMMSKCDCLSYNQPKPEQKTPSVILDPMEYFKYDSVARKVAVDACIAEDIRRLWSAGIETGGCCCGHNERPPNVCILNPGDALKAREILGDRWEILAWVLTPLALPLPKPESEVA